MSTRWYPPEGWSQKAIDRELAKVSAEFERRCQSGEEINRAEKKELEAEAQREAAKVLTLKQYGETVFMPTKAVTASENTRDCYQRCLTNTIYPAIGDLKMPDITSANITALLLSIQSSGKAHATVIKHYTVLSSLFKLAYMTDVVPRNPMDKVERPKPRKDEAKSKPVEAYTAEELSQIADCLTKEPPEMAGAGLAVDRLRDAPRRVLWASMGGCGLQEQHRYHPAQPLLHRGEGGLPGHAQERQKPHH